MTDTHDLVTSRRLQAIKRIEKIESMPRGKDKWYAIRKFYFQLHPEDIEMHKDFVQAVRELRETTDSKIALSDNGHMRNTMKIPQFIYDALILMDPAFKDEVNGQIGDAVEIAHKKLYDAFPEYRVARVY